MVPDHLFMIIGGTGESKKVRKQQSPIPAVEPVLPVLGDNLQAGLSGAGGHAATAFGVPAGSRIRYFFGTLQK